MEENYGLLNFYSDKDVDKNYISTPRLHLESYDCRIKIVDGGWIELRNYHKPIVSMRNFESEYDDSHTHIYQFEGPFEEEKKNKGRVSKHDLYGTIARSSLARTRQKLIEYVTGNAELWKSFITLTYADESKRSIPECNKDFNRFATSMRRACKRNGFEFSYIGVPEFQENGRVHYHLLTNLELDTELIHKQVTNEKYYDVKYWSYGFTSAFDLINQTDDKFNAALYMTKYLYKDFDERLYGSTRLLKSNNLKAPTSIKLLADSPMYIDAINYLMTNGYMVTESYDIEQNHDKPFAVPSSTLVFKPVSGHENINNFVDFLQDVKELEF